MAASTGQGLRMENKPRRISKVEEKNCIGKLFRGYHSMFLCDGTHFGYREGIKLLKRKSCPGCDHCFWMEDELYERANDGDVILPKGGIKQGALYRIEIANVSKDWESGIIDEWDLKIVEVKE
jgi:hypothetical protein